ncbi:MAG TPA: helix-turn-helix transcriptional regulator [Pseudobdellovibrionaceae bacterium]|mgnify:CR=1 FL=1|nr:helix-turn-helix transcriptional regulator [Pseudobdellovibrionaceae bacterium]
MAGTKTKLANFLREARVEAGLSQIEVAKALGYSTSQFISNWERELAAPPVKILKRLGKLYGISSDRLLEMLIEQSEETLRRQFRQSKMA